MKKILLFTVFLGACLLTFIGCAKDELDTTGSIAGIITDAETAKAINGATVTLSPTGKSFTTGVDGRYEFRDIAIGNYTVQATKAGYAQNQKSVEVMAGETSSLDLPLRSMAPKLEVSSQTLDFGNTATTLTLDIRNTGSAELTWQVSEDIQWLSCVPTSGSTSPDKTSSIIVNVDRSGLSRGTYTQTIAIASNGGSQTVKVTLSVQEESVEVDVKPEALDFGSSTSSLQLTLTNTDTCRSRISYTHTASNDWIHLSKTQGQFTYTEVITVSVDRTSLSEGTYSGQLTLTIEGKSKVIPVSMIIAAKAKPTVTLTEVKDVTYNSSSFLGAIVSVGSARVTHHGFVWATAENPTIDTAQKCDLGDAQTSQDFSYTASNLQPATTYYVRAYAENTEGISYSSQQLKFTTSSEPSVPKVETGHVTNLKQKEMTVAGNITDLGATTGIMAHGHVWSTQPNPTVTDQKTDLGETHQKQSFNSILKDLLPGTLYYIRAYARNQYGVGYGEIVQATTLPGEVLLTTKPISDITHNEAVGGGRITELQGHTIAERGVCWNTQGNPTTTGSHQPSSEQSNDFSVKMTDLSENTAYHVRAYVKTSTGDVFYGETVSFTTPYEIRLATLSAVTAAGVTYKSATFAASVTSDGHGTLTDAGFVYSTSRNPTINDSKLSCGAKTDLTASTSTLNPETTYYVRAYATNEKGTAYGVELAFTTKEKLGEPEIDVDDYGNDTEWGASYSSDGISADDYPEDTQWKTKKKNNKR